MRKETGEIEAERKDKQKYGEERNSGSAGDSTNLIRKRKAVDEKRECGETPCAERGRISRDKEKRGIPDRPVIAFLAPLHTHSESTVQRRCSDGNSADITMQCRRTRGIHMKP